MGQLGKLGDETFPARILEYVGLRSKMYSILTAQPDGARKEKRKIKGVPKKAVTSVRHLEHREALEKNSTAQPRARDRRRDRREEVPLALQRQPSTRSESRIASSRQTEAATSTGSTEGLVVVVRCFWITSNPSKVV